MSDPVTNVEIEDVLSSIRRLVSQDSRALETVKTEPAKDDEQAVSDDAAPLVAPSDQPRQEATPALVLTPALRVLDEAPLPEEGEVDAQFASAESHSGDEETEAEGTTSDLSALLEQDEKRDDEPLVLTGTVQEDSEPDTHTGADDALEIEQTEQSDDHSPDTASFEDDEQGEADGALSGHDAGQSDETHSDDPAHAIEDAEIVDEAVEEEAAADETLQDEAGSRPEDATEDHEDEMEVPAWQPEVAAADVDDQSSDQSGEEDAEPASFEDAQLTIEDKISALEALISTSAEEFEPDGAEMSNAAVRLGTSMPWQNDVPPQVEPQHSTSMPDPETPSQAAQFVEESSFEDARRIAREEIDAEVAQAAAETFAEATDSSALPFMDEDMLRDIVADIVRQELQGPLGERITRNVRKLVRREIYRALAANELE